MTVQPKTFMMPAGALVAGRYAVVGQLGRGGMGEVYEVEHTLLGRRFALKRLSTGDDADREQVERFLREARAAAATGHPGIVEVFDLGFAEEGWPFLVMEKLEGETLRQRLGRGPLAEAELHDLAAAVLDSLDAVHRAGIVHRDIKPENIFLCRGRVGPARVKLLDFGLAQLGGDQVDVRLTQSGAVMGTPLYMSPEQARGHRLDARTDLYAVGAVLYECVASRPPFSAASVTALVAQILEREPPGGPLAGASAAVRAAVLRALAKAPGARFDTAAAMRRTLCGAPPDAGPDGGTLTQRAVAEARTELCVGGSEALALPEPPGPATVDTADLGGRRQRGPAPDRAESPPGEPSSREPAGDAVSAAEDEPAAVSAAEDEPAAASAVARPGSATPRDEASGEPAVPASAWRRRARRLAPLAAVALAAGALAVIAVALRGERSGEAPASPTAGAAPVEVGHAPASAGAEAIASADAAIAAGDLERAASVLERAAMRAPDDPALRARDLVLALLTDRQRAYDQARRLRVRPDASPQGAAVADAALLLEGGHPLEAAARVRPLLDDATGDLALRFLHATLLWRAGQLDEARERLEELLARWPAFTPALDRLLQPLLFLEEVERARDLVMRHIAASPDGPVLDKLEIELLIGERRYRDALARLEDVIAADPGREAELYQFRGDLRLLLDDVDGAIAAYDAVGDGPRRDQYVFAALLHAGRVAEARALMLAALEGYADEKLSRLGSLAVDACLLALETGDEALAARAAAAVGTHEHRPLEVRVRGALAFCRAVAEALAGRRPDLDALPLGAASPFAALLASRDLPAAEALALLRPITDPAGMTLGVVSTHVYPALWLERARAALELGDAGEALELTDRVLRPRHYDTSRGVVFRRAMTVRAAALRAAGRDGEARAVERELRLLDRR